MDADFVTVSVRVGDVDASSDVDAEGVGVFVDVTPERDCVRVRLEVGSSEVVSEIDADSVGLNDGSGLAEVLGDFDSEYDGVSENVGEGDHDAVAREAWRDGEADFVPNDRLLVADSEPVALTERLADGSKVSDASLTVPVSLGDELCDSDDDGRGDADFVKDMECAETEGVAENVGVPETDADGDRDADSVGLYVSSLVSVNGDILLEIVGEPVALGSSVAVRLALCAAVSDPVRLSSSLTVVEVECEEDGDALAETTAVNEALSVDVGLGLADGVAERRVNDTTGVAVGLHVTSTDALAAVAEMLAVDTEAERVAERVQEWDHSADAVGLLSETDTDEE